MSIARAHSLFRRAFGGRPTHIASAPGRTNIIGEHTDYNEGLVFPAAIDRRVFVAARVTGGRTQLRSAERGRTPAFSVEDLAPRSVDGWGRYVAGCAWVLSGKTGKSLPNLEAAIASDLPIGAGVSSSAALEVAFVSLWNEICGLGLRNSDIAKLAQQAENEFVGLECGIMDQMSSAIGRKDHAFLLDTRDLEIEYAPLSESIRLIICDTRIPRNLTKTAYNQRRNECRTAAQSLGVASLRDASLELLESHRSKLDDVVFRRARHVVTENDRVVNLFDALQHQNFERVANLMREGHISIRDDYEVSCPELDAMAESAWLRPECLGARMTGAGFGGACIALVNYSDAESFCANVREAYRDRTSLESEFYVCRADDGAFASLA